MQRISGTTRWSLPIASLLVLGLGVFRVWQGGKGDGYALIAAALILIGVMITVWIHALWNERDHSDNDWGTDDETSTDAGRGGPVETWQERWALPAIAAAVLFGGIVRVQDSNIGDGYALLSGGLILVGVWIASYLHDRWNGPFHRRRRGGEPGNETDDRGDS